MGVNWDSAKGMAMRPKGSAAERERLRVLAIERLEEGWEAAEVAEFVGVTTGSVQRWWKAYRSGGLEALKAKPAAGRPRHLSAEQEQQVLGWLTQSPTQFGFPTELWTGRRVAELIRRKLRVKFHPRYVNAWLTGRGITPQKPRREPRERNQAQIDHWVQVDAERIKKRPGNSGRTWC